MKKRMTSVLTLAIFLVGIFGGSVASFAQSPKTQASGPSAYNNAQALSDKNGGNVTIPDFADVRYKEAGASVGKVAYGYNSDKEVPPSQGVTGYKLAADQGEEGYKSLAAHPSDAQTLYNDVRDLMWNGYPYMKGWQGVSGDPMGYKAKYNLADKDSARLTELYNIKVTQMALWKLTDSKNPSGPLAAQVNDLLLKAKANPAPANFKLDLYDGSACNSAAKMTSLLVCVSDANAKNHLVNVRVDSEWYQQDGKKPYIGDIPNVSYELYEGDITAGEKPLYTFDKSGGTISLIDDNQKYTLREVFKTDADKFTAANDQVIDLANNQPNGYAVLFNHAEKGQSTPGEEVFASVSFPVGAEVTMDGKNPQDATFSFVLKDSVGNIIETKNNVGKLVSFTPLQFNKEGMYTYTLNELAGDKKNVAYDASVYTLVVTVAKGETPVGQNPVLTVKHEWKKNGAAYASLAPVFANTTKADATTTLTVKKEWKSDNVNSRPKYVNVQLYRNGTAYGELVRLDQSNGWTYTWKDLDTAYKWTVNEPTVPTGYIKTTKTTGTTWTITNTAKKAPVVTTPGTTKPTVTKPVITKPVTYTADRGTPSTDDPTNLNGWATGAIISLSGMCLIAAVWLISRRKQQSKK